MAQITGKEIIVTGGAGFIGSNLVERLSKDNKITVIDNLFTGSQENLKDAMQSGNVKFINDNVKNIDKYDLKADIVFHLGFASSTPMYRENPHLVDDAVAGMVSVLEYVKKNGSKLVWSSSSSIYSGIKPPHREDAVPLVTDYYTEARIADERLAELYSRLFSVNSVALRFFSVYGKHETFKKTYANLITQFMWWMQKGEQPIVYGDGTQKRDFTHVDDIVEALIRSTQVSTFEIINVGTNKNYTLNEMISKLNMAMGTNISPKYIPMPINNYVMETLADTSKGDRLLGVWKKVTLDEGINRLVKEQ